MTLRVRLATLVLLLATAACSAAPPDPAARVEGAAAPSTPTVAAAAPEATTTTRPPTVEERIAGLVAETAAGRDLAVSVVDDQGAPIVEHRPDAALIPASTAKLVTAAAALAGLGPNFRYRTRVNSTAPVVDGVVHGDLVLIGSGDPTLSHGRHAEAMPERPRTPIEALADRIAAAGATRVTGRLVADPTFFPDQAVAPGAKAGTDSAPLSAGLTVDGGRRVWHDGTGVQSVPSEDPAAQAAMVLAILLAERGVVIDGGTVKASSPQSAQLPLAEVDSPPLIELLRWMVQTSDNHVADAVFRTIGARAGDASWTGSARAVLTVLQRAGFDTSELGIVDGSGLSHHDRLTVSALVDLDEAVGRSRLATDWYSLHAVAGASGTLRNRLVGTPAAGRLAGKTGTLNGVRAFAGVVTGPDSGRPRYRLAVIGNGLDEAGIEAVARLQDDIAVLLALKAAE